MTFTRRGLARRAWVRARSASFPPPPTPACCLRPPRRNQRRRKRRVRPPAGIASYRRGAVPPAFVSTSDRQSRPWLIMPLSFWSVAHAPNPNLDSAGADLARDSETFARGVELGWAFRARALFCAFRGLFPFAFAPARGRSQRWRARARGGQRPSGRQGARRPGGRRQSARERGRRRGRGRESEPTSPCGSCSPARARERVCVGARGCVPESAPARSGGGGEGCSLPACSGDGSSSAAPTDIAANAHASSTAPELT